MGRITIYSIIGSVIMNSPLQRKITQEIGSYGMKKRDIGNKIYHSYKIIDEKWT